MNTITAMSKSYAEILMEIKVGLKTFNLERSPDYEAEEVAKALHDMGCRVKAMRDGSFEIHPPHRGALYEHLIAL